VAIDAAGNTYAAGYIYGTGTFGFGNGVTATGTSSGFNAVLVKYSSLGAAQWAQTLTSGTVGAQFSGVAIDSSSNLYAVGYISGTGSYGFGGAVTAIGTSTTYNSVLVKYSSAGTAQWAQTLSSGTGGAQFNGVTVDTSSNLYAVGYISGTGSYGFGGMTATGTSSANNLVLVKYSSAGTAQWAQTLSSGTGGAQFNGVTVDSSGNIYAVGYIAGTGAYGLGGSVTATGTSGSDNSLIVEYSSGGVPQWAQTLASGTGSAQFTGVTIDASGNTYAVGSITSTAAYGFGNGVTATGASLGLNSVLVKYSGAGVAQWAQPLASGTGDAQFNGVTIDGSGNTYAVGYIYGTGTYGFGNGVTATGTSLADNSVLVKYSSAGTAQWVQTLTSGTSYALFTGATIDGSGNTYAVGSMAAGAYGFDNSVTATGGSTGINTILVKYAAH
jgi:hypothetical protein